MPRKHGNCYVLLLDPITGSTRPNKTSITPKQRRGRRDGNALQGPLRNWEGQQDDQIIQESQDGPE